MESEIATWVGEHLKFPANGCLSPAAAAQKCNFFFFISETQTNGVCKFSLNEGDLQGGRSLQCGNSGHPANLPVKLKDDYFIFWPLIGSFNGRTSPLLISHIFYWCLFDKYLFG